MYGFYEFINSDEYLILCIISTIVNIVCLVVCPIIAGFKNRSVGGWIFGGLFLGLLGLIIVACLPKIDRK